MKPLLLVGGGGHCLSCIDVIETEGKWQIAGVIEQSGGPKETILGYSVLGHDEILAELRKHHDYALVTVGQIKNVEIRTRLFNRLKDLNFSLPIIVSPHAYVSKHSSLFEGSMIFHGAVVNAGASVGSNTFINIQALIEHDAIIGSDCHIATGAKVNGGCVIGKQTFIGSGAVIHQDVQVGEKCIIGAGCIVRENVAPKTLLKRKE
jgi:sugar O-acyltransferase (sialic acid O-acetyltransferase NeuD family)